MRKILFLLIIMVFPLWAGQYPIVDSTESNDNGDDYVTYNIYQKIMEIGPATDYVPPAGWLVGFGRKYRYGWACRYTPEDTTACPYYVDLDTKGMSTADGVKTIGTLAMEAYNRYAGTITMAMSSDGSPYSDPEPSCFAYIGIAGYGADDASQAVFPAGCAVGPPTYEWCKVKTPEIEFDHGSLTANQAEGSTLTVQMKVSCTTATAVKFNLPTNDKYLYMDEGKAEITVNDLPLGTKINLPTGDNILPVKDQLTGVTSEGFHTGGNILVMSPY